MHLFAIAGLAIAAVVTVAELAFDRTVRWLIRRPPPR